jgi:gamma-glutamylcyclotransferase (GGCT)/AIG2-like uncharacterized protein YtfP
MTQPANEAATEFLFAYGTLQPGRAPAEIAPLVEKLEIAGRGFVRGTLYDFGHYPGAVLDSTSQKRIPGTIYKLPRDPGLLARLDEYEEFSPESPGTSQFIRELHAVFGEDGRMILCWVYVFNKSYDHRRIEYRGNFDSG